jgi:Ribonuclease G/E
MPIRKRASLGPALTTALAADPLRPRFLGFSALGLAEIMRTRIHPPLHELLSGPHAAGLTALREIARDLDPDPRRLPTLRAAPAVVEALQRDPVALKDLANRAGRPLTLRSDPSLTGTAWHLEQEHG